MQSKDLLDSFTSELEGQNLPDVTLDRRGYFAMLRVRGPERTLREIATRVPAQLKTTWNLGCLDIQLPRCGKLPAITWLLRRLEQSRAGMLGVESSNREGFVYVGDDDNDIEALAAAVCSFIARPCSAAVQQFMEAHEHPERLVHTQLPGTRGTEDLLVRAAQFLDDNYVPMKSIQEPESLRADLPVMSEHTEPALYFEQLRAVRSKCHRQSYAIMDRIYSVAYGLTAVLHRLSVSVKPKFLIAAVLIACIIAA